MKNSTASLIAGARLGGVIGHEPRAQARRKETKRRHDLARSQWEPNSLPAWLTEEFYDKKIQLQLSAASLSQIAGAINVSIPYASTTTCSNSALLNGYVVKGSVVLTSGSASITGLPFANTSFICVTSDTTAIHGSKMVETGSTTATVTGTGTDVIAYVYAGN